MMKRLLLMMAIMAMTSMASAQIWIGGDVHLEIERDNEYTQDGIFERFSNFSISPELGYDLNRHWSVGMRLSYNHMQSRFENTNYVDQTSHSHSNQYSVAPFVRYYVNDARLRFYVDGSARYTLNHISGRDYSTHDVGLSLSPGLALALTERIGLTSSIGGLSWYHANIDSKEFGGYSRTNSFAFNLSGTLYLGIYVYLK